MSTSSAMTRIALLFVLGFLLCCTAFGQEPAVNAGAITKYTGPSTPASDVKDSRDFLAGLEAHLAGVFAKASGIDYLDRSNLDALFREKRLGMGDDFDPSSGALRGLLGRLDYLIVIEASGPKSARLRIIDVETGAVKGTSVCERSFFDWLSSSKTPECISTVADRSLALAQERRALKKARAEKQENQRRDAESQRTQAEKKRADEQQQADKRRTEELQRQRAQLAADQVAAERQRQADSQRRQHAEAEVAKVRPRYSDILDRTSSEDSFWKDMEGQLRATGHSLRPEIRSAWSAVHSKAAVCASLLESLQAANADSCLDQLEKQLNQLDQYK